MEIREWRLLLLHSKWQPYIVHKILDLPRVLPVFLRLFLYFWYKSNWMFRGNPLRVRKNRRYNYTRYYKGKEAGIPMTSIPNLPDIETPTTPTILGSNGRKQERKCATEATELFLLYYFSLLVCLP